MSAQPVILIDVGQPAWHRWMIFHSEKKRYWSKGTWIKRRRNGELGDDKTEAEKELNVARLGSQRIAGDASERRA
jgi:hypothetical protein